MKTSRQSYINVHRDSWVEVNLEYLAQNVKQIKKLIQNGVKLLAVVKADAYGHGALMVAPTMLASGVDVLGVASIDEGLNLRDAKINCEILVLGAVPIWAFESAVENDIIISIFSDEHINACRQAFVRTGKKVKAHIKVDTGMNRIGVGEADAEEFIKKVQAAEFIDLKGIFSHLACAEDERETKQQFEKFKKIISSVDTKELDVHILNTAGIISYPDYQFNMVRAGIGLYGLMPTLSKETVNVIANKNESIQKYSSPFHPFTLSPIMSLKGRISRIHTMGANEGISYGHTFVANKEVIVATVPIGYADGVPRALSNKIFGEINGKKVKQIGNITMDQMMFDISGIKANEGDVITLLGEGLTIDEWAKIVGTINYELTCRLKVRLPRVYTR
ncbi:MAG TPA: alanine racemase [Candidatus Gastranaerophilaceae bacterium]|nr:alanine racemase [Candidatus Gastranaerophilaceae bacterium]